MKRLRVFQPLRSTLMLSLVLGAWAAYAQETQGTVADWRKANEAVGQYPRGHADVLRWESQQIQDKAAPRVDVARFALASAADAVRAAWAIRPELSALLAQVGPQAAQYIAEGRWGEVDPGMQRWIHGMDELLKSAATTRKDWLNAVAAGQVLKHKEDAVTAAEAAAELGRRMVSIGNWSRYQQAQVAMGESSAAIDLKRAQLAASQAERRLLKSMRLDTVHDRVSLPDRLPDAPTNPIQESELQQRLARIQARLPMAEARLAKVKAQQAYAAYVASIEVYGRYRSDVLKQREVISEETLLRYNGMLESVWGLLADVGARSQAVVEAINAQRDALIAETDLLWVLQGGYPEEFVSLGGVSAQGDSASAGH